MLDEDEPTVLVVEDEPELIAPYEDYPSDTCRVRTATDGAAAMADLDGSVDLILLDRRMPETTGDELLGMIGACGLEPRIALLTAVSPDFDILDLQLDDYFV